MSRSGLPQLHSADFEPQIFWLTILFFVFYLVIKKVITPYFFSEIESRDAYIEENLLKIRELQTQANHLTIQYREKLSFAHNNANVIVGKAKHDVMRQIEDMTYQFSKEAQDTFQKVRLELKEQEIATENDMSVHLDFLLKQASDKISVILSETKIKEISRSTV